MMNMAKLLLEFNFWDSKITEHVTDTNETKTGLWIVKGNI